MTPILLVAALIVALEFLKAGWHGRWQGSLWLATMHTVVIGAMDFATAPRSPWIMFAVTTLSLGAALASYIILLQGRTGWWWEPLAYRIRRYRVGNPPDLWTEWTLKPPSHFYLNLPDDILCPVSNRWHVLSALSSWPVELAAIYTLTVPLWGQWPHFAAACGLWLAVAALCRWGIWRNPRLRPRHWT